MIKVCVARFEDDSKKAIKAIRHQVFCLEQGVDPDLDFDGQDVDAVHALAFLGEKAVGTGRVLADGHIGRVAVLKNARGKNVGEQIVLFLMEQMARQGIDRVFLGAQIHAVPFYEKLGFTQYGDQFMDAGIRHVHMEKYLNQV